MFVDIRRGPNQADFGSKDIELLSLLVPHFERASQINEQMRVADAVASTFSRLPFGAILVDSDLRVLRTNDLAQSWIDTGQIELKCRGGFLTARPTILHELHRLAADACGLHCNGVTGCGGHLTLEADIEADHVADYVIEVAPLFDSPFNDLAGGRCAILTIKKVHMGNPEGFDEYVRSIFSLTRAEARLAVLLAGGYSLKDAAAKVGVKNSTTRTYLEHLFRKTGTHQQSQLVALLKNVAPALLSLFDYSGMSDRGSSTDAVSAVLAQKRLSRARYRSFAKKKWPGIPAIFEVLPDGCVSVVAIDFLAALVALLRFDRQGRDRTRVEPLQRDRLAGFLAIAVSAFIDALQRRIDL